MIRPFNILQLDHMGFKVVPLDETADKPMLRWTEIYENGGWPDLSELSRHYDKFHNVATCLGMTVIRSMNGLTAYLNCLDIDSENALKKLSHIKSRLDPKGKTYYNLIEEACKQTYVTKSRKGYHIYWLSRHELEPVHTHEVPDKEWAFEIKTNKDSGLITLPTSRHRHDAEFRYESIGQEKLDFSDGMYDVLMRELGMHVRRVNRTPYIPKRKELHREIVTLTDAEAAEIAGVVSRMAYAPGVRHQTSLALSGFLCKWGCDYDSARKVFEELVKRAKDEEKQARYADLKETYRSIGKRKLAGYARLQSINSDAARRLMQIVSRIEKERESEKRNGK